ncbi:MAG TPA: HD domain-containing protein [Acidimicrobiales bacterium]|jgi:(p)ppGpp synthase/HD superfamily hydrolase|nr:HD domain-containing protein [Acidimicrobiales bacterium]
MELTERFDRGLQLASDLHRSQKRKSTEIPYITHLMAVASLVLENGGSEDEAIAGLLHDAVEDQGGPVTLELIRSEFGNEIADYVQALSDTDQTPKPPWRARKEAYLLHLEDAPVAVLRISAADKLHNARSIVRDYLLIGEDLWNRFSAPSSEQIWYYRSLSDVFRRRLGGPLASELSRTVADLEWLMVSPRIV